MKPQLLTFGHSQSRVVVIDEVSGAVAPVRKLAAAMAPFPSAGNYYPGLRRFITPADAAFTYVESLLEVSTPYIKQGFNLEGFRMLEASFSMVTVAPDHLTPNQRVPHFDDTDPNYLALLHYLAPKPGTGTAFYRHRATGIERVTAENVQGLITVLKLESPSWTRTGYINQSDDFFEQIGQVDSIPDRLVIYQGGLLHSGLIAPDQNLSNDPLAGRLTANVFIHGYQK